MESIVACRSQISDRFPVASFAIHMPPRRYYEVACATDPRLFHTRHRRDRTRANFFSSREHGLLQAPRGDTAFMVPPEQLQRFAGARRLFYAMASYGSPRGDDAHFSVGPDTLDRMPSISLAADFTGRTLDRTRIGRPRPSPSEYGGAGADLVWGGDLALAAEERRARESDGGYDDGHDASLWEQSPRASGQEALVDPPADADTFSPNPPIALAIAAESGAQCDDTADHDASPSIGGAYDYADSIAQQRDDEQSDEEASGLSAGDADAIDQEDTAYGGYEDAAALYGAIYGDGDSDRDELDSSAASLEDDGDAGSAAYGSVAALDEETPTTVEPGLAGAMADVIGRDADYRFEEELGEEETEFEPSIGLEVRPLDIPEKVRLLRVVARAESGRDGYSAINPDNEYNTPSHPAYHRYHIGLSFGFIQFTQRSGLLGQTLKAARVRSTGSVPPADRFEALFGPDSQQLIDVTNAPTAEGRVAPVGGRPLWEPVWTDRFRRAGQLDYVRAAQNEVAIRECVDPILTVAAWLGFTTPRALSMLIDRVIHMGPGGGLTWVLASCGPLNAEADWRRALAAVGAPDLEAFQHSKAPHLKVDRKFGPRVHAALMSALRKLGSSSPIAVPSRDAMLRRLVDAAESRTFAKRLRSLYDNRADFDDAIAYDLVER
jgi:hypothetical protein